MAKKKNELTLTIPTMDDFNETIDRLRDDVASNLESAGKRAADILPARSRRQFDAWLDSVRSVRQEWDKTVTSVRKDVEGRIGDVRKVVDKNVDSVRKDIDKRRKTTTATVEKETRKQVERLYRTFKLPVRGDIDSLKRRITIMERKLDEIAKGLQAAA